MGRRGKAAAATLFAAILLTPLTAGPASADEAFTLSANAQGVSVEIDNQSIPLITSIQANIPTAQATLGSVNGGTAYSAAPDPSQGVAELPTTGASQVCAILAGYGATVPGCSTVAGAVPAYPYAYAQTGDAPQDKEIGGAHLHAEAEDSTTLAQTIVGASGALAATSTARNTVGTDGSVTSSAESSVDGVDIGPSLTISGIDSSASLQRDPTGKLTTSSSFSIGHLSVAGLSVEFTDGQFNVLGSSVPVPIPTDTVVSALKTLGVTATFLPAITSAGGVTSEGMSLSYTLPGVPAGVVPPLPPLPVNLPVDVGLPTTPTTVTYVLGLASVDSTYHVIPSDDDDDSLAVTPATTAPTTGPAAPSTTAPAGTAPVATPAAEPGTAPALSSPGGTTDSAAAPLPAVDSAGSGGATGPVTAGNPQYALVTSAGSASTSVDVYLAFVVAAFAVFLGAAAIRFLGVRLSWTS